MGDQRVTYRLQYPVKFGSELIEELSLRRMKAKDLRLVSASSSAEMLELIGRLAGQPRVVIDELDAIDVQEVSKIVEGFTRRGPRTGGRPSPS